jgi:hypothetical protein
MSSRYWTVASGKLQVILLALEWLYEAKKKGKLGYFWQGKSGFS